jgi:hypothetical protein
MSNIMSRPKIDQAIVAVLENPVFCSDLGARRAWLDLRVLENPKIYKGGLGGSPPPLHCRKLSRQFLSRRRPAGVRPRAPSAIRSMDLKDAAAGRFASRILIFGSIEKGMIDVVVSSIT